MKNKGSLIDLLGKSGRYRTEIQECSILKKRGFSNCINLQLLIGFFSAFLLVIRKFLFA
jgi:hypothetical protein